MAFSDRALIVCSSVSVLVFILTIYYWRSNNNKRSNISRRKDRKDSSLIHSNLESEDLKPELDSVPSNQVHKQESKDLKSESQDPVPDSNQIHKQDPVPDPEPSSQESSINNQSNLKESEDPKPPQELNKIPNLEEQESQHTKPESENRASPPSQDSFSINNQSSLESEDHKQESGNPKSESEDPEPSNQDSSSINKNQSNLEESWEQESGNLAAPSNQDDAQAQQVAIVKDTITEANIDDCSQFDEEKMQLKNVSTLNVESSSSLSGAACHSNGNSLTSKHIHNNKQQDLNSGDKLESNNNQQKIIENESLSSLNFNKKNRHKRSVGDELDAEKGLTYKHIEPEPIIKTAHQLSTSPISNKNIEKAIKTDELSSPEITSNKVIETQAEPTSPGITSKINEEKSPGITSNKNIESSSATIKSKHSKEAAASQSTTKMDNNNVASSTKNIKKSYSEIIQEKQSAQPTSAAALSSSTRANHKHTASNDNNKTSSPLQPCLNKESNNNSAASLNHINQTTSSTTSTTMSNAAASSSNKSINKASMESINNSNIPDGFGGLASLPTKPVQTITHKQTFAQILTNNCDSINNNNSTTSKSTSKHSPPATSNKNNENDTIDNIDIYHNYPDVTITPTSDDNRNAGHLLDSYNEEFTSQGSNDSGQGSCLNEVMHSLSIIDLDNDNTGHHADAHSPSSPFDTIDSMEHRLNNDAPVADGTVGSAGHSPSSGFGTMDTIGRSNAAPVGRNVNRNELMDASKMSSITSSTNEYFNTSPLFSVIPDNHIIQYNFEIPIDMCGLLIGKKGRFINPLKANTGTNVFVTDYTDKSNICHIYGPKQNVMNALNLIKYRFSMYPELTYNHIDFTPTIPLSQSCQLLLPSDVMSEVYLINTITPGHFFLQQPTHPTYPMLSQLDQMMTDNYCNTHAPLIPTVHVGIICAVQSHDGNWYRATVKHVHDNHKECDLLFVDYGLLSYNVPVNALRQIHCNFMTLPFQAIECYLDKIAPIDVETGWTAESINYFEELARGQIIFAYVERYTENNVACVDLYKHQSDTNTRINIAEELVKSGHAQWI